jgi:inhibitor of KinA
VTEAFRIVSAGDAAFLVEFEPRLDAAVNARVLALWRALRDARVPGVRDVVPASRSLGVYFDPLRTDVTRLVATLESAAAASAGAPVVEGPPIRVPVCYGDAFGPDLDEVARLAGLTAEEVVAIHTASVYRVFMLGFSPGFAYMGSVDPRIAAPRRATPRVKVPAGSVGIAGRQTGIYPAETPGGWLLIGQTPVRPFELGRAQPFLFQAGDAVRFYAIDAEAFARTASVPGRVEA